MLRWPTKLRALFTKSEPPEPELQKRLVEFQRNLDVSFRQQSLLMQALTHRSYLGSNGGDPNLSNERMEFLGDAVLELIVIEFLYRRFLIDREGALTKRKGLLVSRQVLAQSAEWMHLGNYIFMSDAERDSGGMGRASILADTLEAVIGAIYLDQGLESARRFVHARLLVYADRFLDDISRANYKSKLQESVQARYKTHPRYRVVTEMGPDHRKLFVVEVTVRGTLLGRGRGYNKKEAEQNAAMDAVERLPRLDASFLSDRRGGRARERESTVQVGHPDASSEVDSAGGTEGASETASESASTSASPRESERNSDRHSERHADRED